MRLPASDQVNAFLRHVYTALGSISATVVILGLLTQGDATKITNALHQIGDGFSSIIAGLSALIPVLSGLYASWTASRTSRLKAMAADPEVKQVVVATAAVADAVPSNKVVANVAAGP